MQFEGCVSRKALHNAKVIAQVDSKFILVSVTLEAAGSTSTDVSESAGSEPGELLVLIDQHAADERCGVEELQKDYFISGNAELGARTNQLENPIQVEISREEGLLLARYKEYFEYWGVLYTVNITEAARESGMQPKAKIQIQSLPPSILERCRLEPRLLIELMRKEAWKLRDEPGLVVSTRSRPSNVGEEDNNSWVRRFHGCPQGILDLINSRSCRSKFPWESLPLLARANSLYRCDHVQ
jgi:DNA mismatch repair protein MLH3